MAPQAALLRLTVGQPLNFFSHSLDTLELAAEVQAADGQLKIVDVEPQKAQISNTPSRLAAKWGRAIVDAIVVVSYQR